MRRPAELEAVEAVELVECEPCGWCGVCPLVNRRARRPGSRGLVLVSGLGFALGLVGWSGAARLVERLGCSLLRP